MVRQEIAATTCSLSGGYKKSPLPTLSNIRDAKDNTKNALKLILAGSRQVEETTLIGQYVAEAECPVFYASADRLAKSGILMAYFLIR